MEECDDVNDKQLTKMEVLKGAYIFWTPEKFGAAGVYFTLIANKLMGQPLYNRLYLTILIGAFGYFGRKIDLHYKFKRAEIRVSKLMDHMKKYPHYYDVDCIEMIGNKFLPWYPSRV